MQMHVPISSTARKSNWKVIHTVKLSMLRLMIIPHTTTWHMNPQSRYHCIQGYDLVINNRRIHHTPKIPD